MKAVVSAEDKYNVGVYDTEAKTIKWMTKETALNQAKESEILGVNVDNKSVVTVQDLFSSVYGKSDDGIVCKLELFIFTFDDAWLGFTGKNFVHDTMNIVEKDYTLKAQYMLGDDVKIKFKVSLSRSEHVKVTIKCKTFKLKLVMDISSTVEELYDSLVELCTFNLQQHVDAQVDFSHVAQEAFKWFFKEDCGAVDLTDGAVASLDDKSAVVKPLGECGVLVKFVDGDWESITGVYRRDTDILTGVKDDLDCEYDDYWVIREDEED